MIGRVMSKVGRIEVPNFGKLGYYFYFYKYVSFLCGYINKS